MLRVEAPGALSTLQDLGRPGWRHCGVPLCGAVDPLSLAFANHLVGNAPGAVALEMTLVGAQLLFEEPCIFALSGAPCAVTLNGVPLSLHQACRASPGDRLIIGHFSAGCRVYLAVSGGFAAQHVFGSGATYLPAAFGGHQGRALQALDLLAGAGAATKARPRSIVPKYLLPFISTGWVLRMVPGPDFALLSACAQERFTTQPFVVSQRANRMGLELQAAPLKGAVAAKRQSAAVFPGTVQCPPQGQPFLLLADAQTTGGYAYIAQVIRADRHQMGQIRPGNTVRFMAVSPVRAASILRAKQAFFQKWLGYCPAFI